MRTKAVFDNEKLIGIIFYTDMHFVMEHIISKFFHAAACFCVIRPHNLD